MYDFELTIGESIGFLEIAPTIRLTQKRASFLSPLGWTAVRVTSMPRTVLVLACLIGLGLSARPALGQSPRKSILLEILLPEDARLFVEGQDTKTSGSMRRFESPPLPPGKYTYTIKAIVSGAKGPQTIT